jgi:hypothetical protein
MSAPLVLTPLPASEPKPRRQALQARPAKPAKAKRPKADPAAKVWTGARKRIAVSQLQMSLPGMGQLI